MASAPKTPQGPAVRNRYEAIIERIFQRHHEKGATQFTFNRDEIEAVAKQLKIVLPKNLGDVIYSFRYRTHLPETIRNKAANGLSKRPDAQNTNSSKLRLIVFFRAPN